ncbi:MAG: hypothetical protein KDB53_03535, partial [Planctomycetes bacterium]|nr:hypothetical protein [Planctomycetota bacterium]
ARRGLVVHALALGSSAGAKIPVATEDGEVFLKDATGRDIVTRPEPGDLMAIADATGGSFRQAQARRGELLEILDRRIRPLARRSLESERFEHRENRFQWFLCAALILWMLEFALTDRSPR